MTKYYHIITEQNDEYISTVAIAENIETVKAHFAGQNVREIIELNTAQVNTISAADIAAMLTETALKRFTCEVERKALGDDGKRYDAVWCPDYGQIYYTIPAKVKVLGYIPQYKEG